MAYRRQASLPGTQQYGLSRRKTRVTEQFPFNPNMSRASLTPATMAAPTTSKTSVSLADRGGYTDLPGLESEAAGSDIEGKGFNENETLAAQHAMSQTATDLLGVDVSSIPGLVASIAQQGLKGALNSVFGSSFSPINMAKFMASYRTSYQEALDSLNAADEARSSLPSLTQHEIERLDPQLSSVLEGRQGFDNKGDDAPFGNLADLSQDIARGEPKPSIDPELESEISQSELVGRGPSGPSGATDSLAGGGSGPPGTPGHAGMASGPDSGDGGGDGGGGGGGTVICTALYNMGLLDEQIYRSDSEYGKKHIDQDTYTGYVIWARHLAKIDWLIRLSAPWIRAWAMHMHYRMIVSEKTNIVGKITEMCGVPICRAIGKTARYLNDNNSQRILS